MNVDQDEANIRTDHIDGVPKSIEGRKTGEFNEMIRSNNNNQTASSPPELLSNDW